MPLLNEGRYAGEFVVSEGNGRISRETITVLSGQNLAAAAVLGKVTASGKYKALAPAAVDGSEAAAGVLYDAVDASAADAEGVAIVRLAEVSRDDQRHRAAGDPLRHKPGRHADQPHLQPHQPVPRVDQARRQPGRQSHRRVGDLLQ
jgi:hypothetical protein